MNRRTVKRRSVKRASVTRGWRKQAPSMHQRITVIMQSDFLYGIRCLGHL